VRRGGGGLGVGGVGPKVDFFAEVGGGLGFVDDVVERDDEELGVGGQGRVALLQRALGDVTGRGGGSVRQECKLHRKHPLCRDASGGGGGGGRARHELVEGECCAVGGHVATEEEVGAARGLHELVDEVHL